MGKLLSVSLPDEMNDRIDELAELQGRSRSEVVREALRSHLWEQRWIEATRSARAAAERLAVGPEDSERLVDETRDSG